MSVVIRMHFDGKVFIPDQPVDVPINEPIEAELHVSEHRLAPNEIKRRRAALRRFAARAAKWPDIPLEALRRENIYEPPRGL